MSGSKRARAVAEAGGDLLHVLPGDDVDPVGVRQGARDRRGGDAGLAGHIGDGDGAGPPRGGHVANFGKRLPVFASRLYRRDSPIDPRGRRPPRTTPFSSVSRRSPARGRRGGQAKGGSTMTPVPSPGAP